MHAVLQIQDPTCLSSGWSRVRHMMIASISVRSVYDSSALTRMRSSCFTSESLTVLLIQPNTMMARGCSAGLYWNAKLRARSVQSWRHLHSFISFMQPWTDRHKSPLFSTIPRLVIRKNWSEKAALSHFCSFSLFSYSDNQSDNQSDYIILTLTQAAFLFSSHLKREKDREAHLNYYTSSDNRERQLHTMRQK